jgi:hypothetical protein
MPEPGPAGSGGDRGRGPAGRRTLVASVWTIWALLAALAAVLAWRGLAAAEAAAAASMLMWAAGLVMLLPYLPLRALAAWRCRSAARRLPGGWRSGAEVLPRWPGVRDSGGALTMRCGSSSFRLWVLGLGLLFSGYLVRRLDGGGQLTAFDLVLSLAPTLCALMLSALWGPAGWLLSVDSQQSKAVLTLWRALRRGFFSSVSLPTVQGVELAGRRRGGYRSIVVRRAKGADWKLGIPGTWPPELVEALAARLAGLAGVEFGKESGENIGNGSRDEVGAAVEEVAE